MIYVTTVLGTVTMLGGAVAVIATTLDGRRDAVIAALIGTSSDRVRPPLQRRRSPVRLVAIRPLSSSPLRAAA